MGGKAYTSARITTKGKRTFQYGRIEIRAKIPRGKGIWGAIWMLGENIDQVGWPACGEVDIMEHVGFEPDIVHATMHTPSSRGASQNSGSITKSDFEDEFYVYMVEKTADKMRFFVDDELFYTYNPSNKNDATWPFEQNFFLILNTAVGGDWGGQQGIDDSIFPQKMVVDYVRLYGEAEVSISGEDHLPSGSQNVIFQTQVLDGATYQWTVPEGVQIVSGQGTSEVKVNWNDKNGEIKVAVEWDEQSFEASHSVEVIIVPEESYHLDISPEHWQIANEFLNVFHLSGNEQEATIHFEVNDPSKNPYLLLKLSQPLSMEVFSKLSLKIKGEELPSNMRVDLIDANGLNNETTHLFKLEPLNADGVVHSYSYYFEDAFSTSSIDEKMIKELKIYMNYGVLGEVGSGSLSISDIWVDEVEESKTPLAPLSLEAEVLESSIVLSWEDQAENEQGYKIYRKVKGAEEFELIAEHLSVDQLNFYDEDLKSETSYIYQIAAFNQFGESNSEELEMLSPFLITATAEDLKEGKGALLIKPNPAEVQFTLEWTGEKLPETTLSIRNELGQLIRQNQWRNFQSERLNVNSLKKGVYIIHLSSSEGNYVKKLVIR